MQETLVRSLGREDPLEKEMATHSSTLAWRIPWREEPGRLQSMGSQRVGHDWATSLHFTPQIALAILVYSRPREKGSGKKLRFHKQALWGHCHQDNSAPTAFHAGELSMLKIQILVEGLDWPRLDHSPFLNQVFSSWAAVAHSPIRTMLNGRWRVTQCVLVVRREKMYLVGQN